MRIDIRRFQTVELKGWWERTSPRLLVVIDVFAARWGPAAYVSPHPRAVGREDGPEDESQHNVDRWGEVRGIDLMLEGLRRRSDAVRAVRIAEEVGFTGIGLYPHWQPGAGIHGDVRTSAQPGNPATWGGVRRIGADGEPYQVYVSLQRALEEFEG